MLEGPFFLLKLDEFLYPFARIRQRYISEKCLNSLDPQVMSFIEDSELGAVLQLAAITIPLSDLYIFKNSLKLLKKFCSVKH